MIRIAHSPDADDFFLFWPIRRKLIVVENDFEFTELDTEDLNRAALNEEFDICAVSTALYPKIRDSYLVLPSGMSVGRNYGPVVVAREPIDPSALNDMLVGIPGENTTAALLLRALAPGARTVEIPLTPYSAAFDAVQSAAVDAAVLIHEGQIAFADHRLHAVKDLGKFWFESTSLPLPLGMNVIHRRLGPARITALSALLKTAASFALEHTTEILPDLHSISQLHQGKLQTLDELRRYLGMYANQDSVDAPEDCRRAVDTLLNLTASYAD